MAPGFASGAILVFHKRGFAQKNQNLTADDADTTDLHGSKRV
jgi:hypothetical protein